MLLEASKDQGWVLCTAHAFFYKAHANHKMPKKKKKVKADARSKNIYFVDTHLYLECGRWGGTGARQTWLAVAVAKGTLVADVVAADTVAGVAPCIMGTWRKRSHRQSNQIPHPQKTFCLTLVFFFVFFGALYLTVYPTGCWQTQHILQQSLLPSSSTNYNNEAATDAS